MKNETNQNYPFNHHLPGPFRPDEKKRSMTEIKSYKCVSVYGQSVRVHRLVMEAHIGRALRSDEIVHHKDGNIWNNDIGNLEIHTRKSHALIHSDNLINRPKHGVTLVCNSCGSEKYYTNAGKSKIPKQDGYKCRDCYIRYSKKSAKKKRREVIGFDSRGEQMGIFKSASDAARKLNIKRTAITNVINGYSVKTRSGYRFKYKEA